jgi:hypothetical protein
VLVRRAMRLVETVEMGLEGRATRMRECEGREMVMGCMDRKKRISQATGSAK